MQSPDSDIRFERRGTAGVVTLNRPQALNAVTHHMVRALAGQAVSQASMAPARNTVGKIISLTVDQPKYASTCPEENELSAMLPKIRKSLSA